MSSLIDGVPLRQHLQVHWKQIGYDPEQMPDQLRPIECAGEVKYLWEYWVSMHSRRGNNGFGSNPISDEGVLAWSARHRVALSAFENQALDGIERIFLQFQSKQAKSK